MATRRQGGYCNSTISLGRPKSGAEFVGFGRHRDLILTVLETLVDHRLGNDYWPYVRNHRLSILAALMFCDFSMLLLSY
jgi:hypothetical protein